jgi:hypothetical protein
MMGTWNLSTGFQELPYNSGETFVVGFDRTRIIAAEIHRNNDELRIEGIFKRESRRLETGLRMLCCST